MASAPVSRRPRLLGVFAGEALSPPPVWLMRQAGRYLPEYRALRARAGSFLDLCYAPDMAAEVTLQPIRRYGFDAAILFSDILVVPDALGQKLEFVEGEGPRLEPIRTGVELARLNAAATRGRYDRVFETVSRVRQELPPDMLSSDFAARRGRWRPTWSADKAPPIRRTRGRGPIATPADFSG